MFTWVRHGLGDLLSISWCLSVQFSGNLGRLGHVDWKQRDAGTFVLVQDMVEAIMYWTKKK